MRLHLNGLFLSRFLYINTYILLVSTTLLGCGNKGNRGKEYYKDYPENFMLSVLDNNTDLYSAIKQDWLSSFKQDEKK